MRRSTLHKLRLCLVATASLLVLAACNGGPKLPRLDHDAVILAFGDSLTRGNGAPDSESYPAILQRLSGRRVINAGVSGELSAQGLKRLPAMLDKYHPDLLILCHGGNDILRRKDINRMADNVRRMIQLAETRRVPVILLGVPGPGLYLSAAPVYGDIAKSTGALYIADLVPDILGDRSLKSDSVHPNGNGYHRMAETIYVFLQQSGAL
jgi:acyl-CoA thioesterase-1